MATLNVVLLGREADDHDKILRERRSAPAGSQATAEQCTSCGYSHSCEKCRKCTSDSPDPKVLPKGFDMVPIVCWKGKDGKRYKGPPVIAVPIACILCFKFGDHWAENCPDKDNPKSRAFRLQMITPKQDPVPL